MSKNNTLKKLFDGSSKKDASTGNTADITLARATQRGIFLLPNLLTTGTLFGGFFAILASMQGDHTYAAIAIFVAMFFDGLDGRVARMTNTQSEFGVQYDSLADLVAFGVAPAVLSYSWMLEGLGKVGWSFAFVYVSCAALRLARFNVAASKDADKSFFIGLASPPAAALIASMVWSGNSLVVEDNIIWSAVAGLVTVSAGLLMVAGVRYPSFKEINFAEKVPFKFVLAICLAMALVMIDPAKFLLVIAFSYALSAPIAGVYRSCRSIFGKKNASANSVAATVPTDSVTGNDSVEGSENTHERH